MPAPCKWFARLTSVLDRRSAPRLAHLFLGGPDSFSGSLGLGPAAGVVYSQELNRSLHRARGGFA
jgi:hypothetical protein